MINLVKRQQRYSTQVAFPARSAVPLCTLFTWISVRVITQCLLFLVHLSFKISPAAPSMALRASTHDLAPLFPYISAGCTFAVISWKSAFFHPELFVNNSTNSVFISFQWYCRISIFNTYETDEIWTEEGQCKHSETFSLWVTRWEYVPREAGQETQTQVPQSESVTGCLSWCHYPVALSVTMWPSVLKYPFALYSIMLPSQGSLSEAYLTERKAGQKSSCITISNLEFSWVITTSDVHPRYKSEC